MKQKTLKKEVSFKGIGVHTGLEAQVVLYPAPVNTGIVFVNSKFTKTKIEVGRIIPEVAMHASVIKKGDFIISTVEHLMASISALFIDNLIIEIIGPEIPILDGSAFTFVNDIKLAGLKEQEEDKFFLTPKCEIKFEDDKGRLLRVKPALLNENTNLYDKNLYIDSYVDFAHPLNWF